MCPNCVLNQAGLQPGVYVAYFICALFFVIALVAMRWAFHNGEFDDMEDSKFDMLDDEFGAKMAEEARARVEATRAAQAASLGK